MAVLKIAAAKNFSTESGLSNALTPCANLLTTHAPINASHVFPAAIPRLVPHEPCVVRLTRNAPIKTAGQRRAPQSSKAASAKPVGGHTADVLAFTSARERPNFPRPK